MKRPKKADNRVITVDLLAHRTSWSTHLGFTKQKWVEFCEVMLAHGLSCTLYEARQTVSKYITVHGYRQGENLVTRQFKVRFSNHEPIKHKEAAGTCDFFVGRTNFRVTNTQMAISATLEFFNLKRKDIQ